MKFSLPVILFGLLNSCAVAGPEGYEVIHRQCDEHRAFFNQCVRSYTCGNVLDQDMSEVDSGVEDMFVADSGVEDMFVVDSGLKDMFVENSEVNICNVSDDSNLVSTILDACRVFKDDYDNCMNELNVDSSLDEGVSNDLR